MIRRMGKKAQQIIETPLDRDLAMELAYYARKCGIIRGEALRIIREANAPKLDAKRRIGRGADSS